jgi:uncharacterized membrane protein
MRKWFAKSEQPLTTVARRNIASVAQIEQAFLKQLSPIDRVSQAITRFVGSWRFIIAHFLFFATWIVINTVPLAGGPPFDPYPFVFLNLMVVLETVFLSTFVLMSQNRQNRQSEHWAHLHLQVGLLAEQETTKMLEMLQAICHHLGLQQAAQDRELKEMIEKTQVEVLAEELQKARGPEEPPRGK